jgi:DNA polymerase III epsilon subunit-like protein
MYYLSLDFETGGLHSYGRMNEKGEWQPGSPILQYGALIVDENFDIVAMREGLVKPEAYDSYGHPLVITEQALKVNKLDVSKCQTEGETVQEMVRNLNHIISGLMIEGTAAKVTLVGSNPQFDLNFWKEAVRKTHGSGKTVPTNLQRRTLDVYELNVLHLFKKLGMSLPEAQSNASLSKFTNLVGIEHKAHDALGDALAVVACLKLHFKR